MFTKETKNTINGWGMVFRFITPLMLTLALWILTGLRNDITDIRSDARNTKAMIVVYNTNHLRHHAEFEIELCERVASMEAYLKDTFRSKK